MTDELRLLIMIILPFLGSALAALLPPNTRNHEAWASGVIALIVIALGASFYPQLNGAPIRAEFAWIPELGLNFVLRIDGFAWLFVMLVSIIGLLVVMYARYYMSRKDPLPRFYAFLMMFMGSMLGIVLSGNLIQLVFFWELTSLASFLLIGYWHHNANARDGARMALIVTSAGGLCLLVGVLLLGHIVGSYDLDVVLAAGDLIRNHDLYLPTLILILLGALTKSAQFPFHFWLPHAMAAPTPVSAYLHSATMVKAGVFLLVRLWPVLAGTEAWFWIVGSAGLITLVLGAFYAMFQSDLKGILAYSTISHLGLITLLAGLGSEMALIAAIFHILNHATFKASLFMAAGIVDHEAGTRDIRRLSGLYRFMPITATLAMVAAAAMAGVPLLNGFLSKEMFFAETLVFHADSLLDRMLPFFAVMFGVFSVVYSLRLIHGVFFGPPPTDLDRTPQEAPRWLRFPIEMLVLACIVVGALPSLAVRPLLDVAALSVLGGSIPDYSLAIWHGFSQPFMMSVAAFVGGILIYALFYPYLQRADGPPLLRRVDARRVFDQAMVFLSWRVARPLADLLGTRRLQPQLGLVVIVALIAGLLAVAPRGLAGGPLLSPIDLPIALILFLGSLCAIAAAWQAKFHRLAALIMMGGAGLVTCIAFVWFSAPDLALTQLLVEIVTTVLLLLGLRWLPKRSPEMLERDARSPALRIRRLRDFALAVAAGGGVTALAYAAMTRPAGEGVGNFFLENAYSGGGGTNVVNVILVDFRAFDTLGEITVLAIVALAVFALLRRFRPAPESIELPEQQRAINAYEDQRDDVASGRTLADSLFVPALIMRLVFPVIAALAAYFFVRGHDLPGGGFIAGVTMSIAFILQYMAGGTRWIESRLTILPVRWMGAGLLVAGLTGLGAWAFGHPFLTSWFTYADLPIIGRTPLATAVLFDLGVFAVVVGATVLMLIALAHQSIRSHRPPRIESEEPERPGGGA